MILAERRGARALPARLMLRAVQRLRGAVWALTRPRTTGARAICLTREGAIVLVRHSYVAGWFLPGGGPAAGEDETACLLRELREEIGLVDHGPVAALFAVAQRANHKRDRQTVYLVQQARIAPRLSLEIEAIGAFALDRLPPLHPSTRWKLDRWRTGTPDGPAPDED